MGGATAVLRQEASTAAECPVMAPPCALRMTANPVRRVGGARGALPLGGGPVCRLSRCEKSGKGNSLMERHPLPPGGASAGSAQGEVIGTPPATDSRGKHGRPGQFGRGNTMNNNVMRSEGEMA